MAVNERSFLEGFEYARSKVHKSKSIEEALGTLDDIIIALKEQRHEAFDEDLVVVQ